MEIGNTKWSTFYLLQIPNIKVGDKVKNQVQSFFINEKSEMIKAKPIINLAMKTWIELQTSWNVTQKVRKSYCGAPNLGTVKSSATCMFSQVLVQAKTESKVQRTARMLNHYTATTDPARSMACDLKGVIGAQDKHKGKRDSRSSNV